MLRLAYTVTGTLSPTGSERGSRGRPAGRRGPGRPGTGSGTVVIVATTVPLARHSPVASLSSGLTSDSAAQSDCPARAPGAGPGAGVQGRSH